MPGPHDYDFIYKYVIIGDMSTGKSSLLSRFTTHAFSPHRPHTVGVEFSARIIRIPPHRIKLHVWDTAGQERFRSVTKSYYRGAAGCILVYDVTRRSTYDHVVSWLEEVRDMAGNQVVVMMVGNKVDLGYAREVSREEAEGLAKRYGMLYAEASAKTNDGVDACFLETASRIYELVATGSISTDDPDSGVTRRHNTSIKIGETSSKSRCCG